MAKKILEGSYIQTLEFRRHSWRGFPRKMKFSDRIFCQFLTLFWAASFIFHLQARASADTVIDYWTGWTGRELERLKTHISDFERSHPTIKVNVLSVAGAYQKVRIAYAGGAPPDVCSALWPEDLPDFVIHGYVENLMPFMRASHRELDEWVPPAQAMMSYQGGVYGISLTANPFFLFLNTRLLREASVDPHAIKTIDSLTSAILLTTKRDQTGRLVQIGLLPPSFVEWAPKFGGKLYDESRRSVTPDDRGNVLAMRWIKDLVSEVGADQLQGFLQLTGNMQGSTNPFYGERAAMLVSSVWEESMLAKFAPQIEYAYVPCPALMEETTPSAFVSGSIFVLSRASRKKQAAWEFLNWLSRPEVAAKIADDFRNVPALRACSRHPRLQSPLMQFAMQLVASPTSYVPPRMPLWTAYRSALQQAEEKILYAGGDIAEELSNVRVRIQPKLDDLARYLGWGGGNP